MSLLQLSDAEKTYIINGIEEEYRLDGRACFDYRCIEVETNVLANCNGSSHVKLDNNDIIVGVKVEVMAPSTARPDLGEIVFHVDCSANASPLFEGRGGEDMSNHLVDHFSTSIPSCLDLKSLCIVNGKHAWIVHVDILILECGSMPSLLDGCSICVNAALYDTKIPRLIIDEDDGISVSDDPFEISRLDISSLPLFMTLTRIGNQYVVDVTQEEEASSIASVVVAFNPTGSIEYLKKVGFGTLHPDPLTDVLEKAKCLAIKFHRNLKICLEQGNKSICDSNTRSFIG